MLNQLDTSGIKCYQLSTEKSLFFYSTASGYLFCFALDLEMKFCFEEPKSLEIVQFVYHEETNTIVYATDKGTLHRLSFSCDFKSQNE